MRKKLVVAPDLTPEWLERYRRVQGEILQQLVRGIRKPGEGLTLVHLHALAEHRNPFARRERRVASVAPPVILPVPKDGEKFDLEVDYDLDPMEVVRAAGHDSTEWQFLGPQQAGKMTIRTKLVRFGYCRDLAEAKTKAAAQGCRLAEGHALVSFREKFPKPGGGDVIVFGGSGWRDPSGFAAVAVLDEVGSAWYPGFGWGDYDFDGLCRWLVVCA